jgi:anti-anti-sigma regulatory factor
MEGDQVYSDKQLVILRSSAPRELSITGAIDYFNAEAVASAVAGELRAGAGPASDLSEAILGNGDLHIDLSRLEFTDVTGIRALVQVAENAGDGRRLVLRGLPPRIRMVMAVVGWGDLPNLVIDEHSSQEEPTPD